MYNAIIFDFDGIILDSEPLHYKASHGVLLEIGIHLSYEDYLKNYIGLSDTHAFHKISKAHQLSLSSAEIEALIKQKSKRYLAFIQETEGPPLIPNVEDFINKITVDYDKIGICSGSKKIEILTALDQLKHRSAFTRFKSIVAGDEVTRAKPSPEGYLLTAKHLEVSPMQCVAIEDSPPGIEAAKAAGMHTIALMTTHGADQLQKADRIFENYPALIKALF